MLCANCDNMKNLNLIFLLIISITLLSCKQSSLDKAVSEDRIETIKLLAQNWPGREPIELDMPIDKGLDKLEISEPDIIEIDSNELVLGIAFEDTQLAVPLTYLSGFEVANLFVDSNNYLLTWCPLVGSARIFEGNINGDKSGFDFGRALWDNNLLIVDRKTNTVWNQLSCKAIYGELEGERLTPLPSIQSTWAFWKSKYPDTKLLINNDTSEAVFPGLVYQKQYYNTWAPDKEYPPERNTIHQIQNLGLGVELGSSSIFLPFEKLFEGDSPMEYTLEDQELLIHFDESGYTAWAEDKNGNMIPGTIVYDWAWNSFFPDSGTYGN